MDKRKKVTVAGLLKADDGALAVLSELADDAENIESLVCVIRRNDGDVRVKYFANIPEIIGLLELGNLVLTRKIEEQGGKLE